MAKILVVHDRPADAEVLVHCLEGQGHTVIACRDGWNAAQSAASERPGLVIVDLLKRTALNEHADLREVGVSAAIAASVPCAGGQSISAVEPCGIELCRILKRSGCFRRISVLLLVDGSAEFVPGLGAGADLCLPRSLQCEVIADRVHHLVRTQADRHGLERRNRQLRKRATQRRRTEQTLRHRVRFEALVNSVSTRLIHVESADLDAAIFDTLEELGRFTAVERCFLLLFSDDLQQVVQTFEWCAAGLEPVVHRFRDMKTSHWPWWMQQMRSLKTVGISRLSELSAEAQTEHQDLQAAGLRGGLAVPLACGDQLKGFLGFGTVGQNRSWSDEDAFLLRAISDLVATAVMRKRAEDRMRLTVWSADEPDRRRTEETWQALKSEVENALRENLQSLFNSLDDFLWILDAEGTTLMVNRVVTQRLGYTEGELIGANVLMVYAEGSRSDVHEIALRTVAGEVNSCRGSLLAKAGDLIPVETRVTRGHWQDHEALFFVSRDTTERLNTEREVKQYTEALEAANRALEEYYCKAEVANRTKTHFLANMSHELRTPLHGILSFASFGIKKIQTANSVDLLHYFQKIEHSGKVLLALVNDLLDLAKLESGRMTYNVDRVDLYMLVLSAIDECSSLASHRGIAIDCGKPQHATRVFADQAKIMQVLRNLLSNAIRFSPEGGTIDVEMQATERTVAVSVLDRGVGIPEDELEAVFDKFIQSSKTRTGAGGTGLGLAICREIVSAHGGQIRAANRPGGGAVLTFELPLVFKPPEVASHGASAMPASLDIIERGLEVP